MSKYGQVSKTELGVYVLVGAAVLVGTVWFLGKPVGESSELGELGVEEGQVIGAEKLPVGFPVDFPFVSGVEVVSGEGGGQNSPASPAGREYRIQLKTPLPKRGIITWYTSQLPRSGWVLKSSNPAGENGYSFALEKPEEWSASLMVQEDSEAETSDLSLSIRKVK